MFRGIRAGDWPREIAMRSRGSSRSNPPDPVSFIMVWCICLLALVVPAGSICAQELDDLNQLKQELEKTIEELSQRLESVEDQVTSGEDLELQIMDLEERVGSRALAKAFDSIGLDFGGFLTQQYTVAVGEKDTEDSFNATQFELLIKADVSTEWSLFTALGFLRESDLDFADPKRPVFRGSASRNPQIISWANYYASDVFQIRFGRIITPHGIINIEHFPPVLLDLNQPQFLRPFPGSTIFPNFQNGVEVHGTKFLGEGDSSLEYSVYGAAFTGSDSGDLNFGGRVAYSRAKSGLTAGVNYSHGRRSAQPGPLGNLSIVGKGSLTSNDYEMVGCDLLFDKGRILFKSEVFLTFEHRQENRRAFYVQPAYRFNDKWIGFYRFDYLDPGQRVQESTEHVIGVNFLPVPTVRLRGVVIAKDFDRPSTQAEIFQLSATVSF